MKVDNIESNKYAINILMIVISQDQAKAKYLLDFIRCSWRIFKKINDKNIFTNSPLFQRQ